MQFDERFDVVLAGSGLAGGITAITAADAGARESRWAQLLCGAPASEQHSGASPVPSRSDETGELGTLRPRVERPCPIRK